MLRNYLLTAWKVFMRRKLFTAINLACIVLTLVVLMVVSALLETAFWPKGVEGRSERMLQVYSMYSESADGSATRTTHPGWKTIDRYFKTIPGIERVSAFTIASKVSVYQDGRVSEVDMRRVDADYWHILDFKLLAGRLPGVDDERAGRMVAVLNATTARRLFGDGAAPGRRIVVGGQAFTVIGVVADVLHMNAYADIWAPVATFPSSNYLSEETGNFSAMLLAKDAADLPRIRREVARIGQNFVSDDPATWKITRFWADSKIDLFARELLGNHHRPDSGAGELLASIAVAMLLFMLLPALNLVNLNMGRTLERSTEIGVRKAFGATGVQLAGQLVIENILLCLAGGLLGLACTQGALWLLERSRLIPYLDVDVDLAVFGWGLLLAFVFGLLSGLVPAWKMSRLDPVHALKGNA
ncbi:ABC transporter permease [uncultured Massilia sp.]|uniref:ABC transporter permease n=1 Tax=uncultured Massilia sp. TaxID=169973 RepID=UPI0025F3292D|nr:ABC transporter permease [uncultured Massilia sp.]